MAHVFKEAGVEVTVTEHIRQAEQYAVRADEDDGKRGSNYGLTYATLALAHANIALAMMKAES